MAPIVLLSARLTEAGFSHGFFTRAVSADWEPACVELGVPRERLYLLTQVHGTVAARLTGEEDHRTVREREGDITFSSSPGVACGTRVADCAPVLIACPKSGAVAAVHSGWRGTVQHAVAAGVRAFGERTGAEGLIAAIGPLIERCCFEVGDDVANELVRSSTLGGSAVDFSHGRPRVDLRRVLAAQLQALGVTAIDQVGGCSRCDSERFHSFRRDGAAAGRMLAAIVARGAAPGTAFQG